MSYAVRNDGAAWRAVGGPADCGSDERWQAEQPAPPTVLAVPQSVTPVQAFTALDQSGKLGTLMAYIDAPTTPPLVRATALGATEWRRDSLMLMTVAIVLGLSPEQVDALFVTASGVSL